MIAKNDFRNLQIEEIYTGSVYFETTHKPAGLAWVKSLQTKKPRVATNESIDLVRKDVCKTKPYQIKRGIEDLDQNNRQIKIGMNFMKQMNKNLKAELEQESSKFDYIKAVVKSSKPIVAEIKRPENRTPSSFFDQLFNKEDPCMSNLDKNIELQIYYANLEIRKLDHQLKSMKSSPNFYNLVDIIAVRNAYFEEFERIVRYREQLSHAHSMVRDGEKNQKREKFVMITKKLRQAETKLERLQTEIDKLESFVKDLRLKTKSLMKEDGDITGANERLMLEINSLDADINNYTSILEESNQ
jgi:hypothetical protein